MRLSLTISVETEPILELSALCDQFSVQFSSVAQSCPTLCDPMNCITPGPRPPCPSRIPGVHQNSCSSKLMFIESMMPSSHLILCRPLLLLPPIPPSIRVFSNELTLHMRWPKYWSFSLSISPSCCDSWGRKESDMTE